MQGSVRRLATLILLFPCLAQALEAPIQADAYVRGDKYAGNNFGASSALWVRDQGPRYSLLRFDTTTFSGRPTQARLSLRIQTLSTPGTFDVHRLIEAWDESTVKLNQLPAYDPMIAGTLQLTAADANAVVDVDILPAAEAWLDGATNHGLIIIPAGSINARISSREGNTAPALNLETEPTPPHIATVRKVGGDYTSPIDALDNIDSGDVWCGSPSAQNPCLIDIGPGVYELRQQRIEMRDYVSISGAGPQATILTYDGDSHAVLAFEASHFRLSNLRVDTSSASDGGVGVYASQNVHLVDLHIVAKNTGIIVSSSSDTFIRSTTIDVGATEPAAPRGVGYTGGSNHVIEDTRIRIVKEFSASNTVSGLSVVSDASVVANRLSIEVLNASGTGAVYAAYNRESDLTLKDSSLLADGGTSGSATAAWAGTSGAGFQFSISNSRLVALGVSARGVQGLSTSSPSNEPIRIDRSLIQGDSSSVYMTSGSFAWIGSSRLDGPVVGTLNTCAASYNGNYVPLGADCQ
ncbi:MAG: DNRLRE domain-containing protein [Pseudomonadota bacterium]